MQELLRLIWHTQDNRFKWLSFLYFIRSVKVLRIYKANEVDDQRFYQIPKSLISEKYKYLSSDAKLLYMLLRDRMELSSKNGWVNGKGEVYLIFTREEVGKMLYLSKPTVTKAFNQLIKHELIFEKRQGLTKPNIIYVCHVGHDEDANFNRSKESLLQNTNIFAPNDTDLNETDHNHKHKGAISNESRTVHSKAEPLDIETVEAISTFMNDYYKQKRGKQHPRLKAEQYKQVYESIKLFMDDNCIDGEGIKEMMCNYFNRMKNADFNINHFATEGIMMNCYYEAAL